MNFSILNIEVENGLGCKGFKDHPGATGTPWAGNLQLNQVAQSPIRPWS